MPGRLDSKVAIAIVTGAGCVGPGWGNGRAAVAAFVRESAQMFAIDIGADVMAETMARAQEVLGANGGGIRTHTCDGMVQKPPFPGDASLRPGASGMPGRSASQNSLLKPSPDWGRVHTSFGRDVMVDGTGQGPGHGRPVRDAAPPRMRRNGQPAAAYAWHVAPGGVLIVVDLDRDGWRSVTNDAAGIVHDLAELRPDLLARVPLIPYRDSVGEWHVLRATSKGIFAGFAPIGAASETEAVAWVLTRHG